MEKSDDRVTQQILTIAGVSQRQRSTELVQHVHSLRSLSGFLSGAEVRHIDRTYVRSKAIAKARVSTLRFFVDDLPAFTGPVQGLWEDDLQVAVIEPTSS